MLSCIENNNVLEIFRKKINGEKNQSNASNIKKDMIDKFEKLKKPFSLNLGTCWHFAPKVKVEWENLNLLCILKCSLSHRTTISLQISHASPVFSIKSSAGWRINPCRIHPREWMIVWVAIPRITMMTMIRSLPCLFRTREKGCEIHLVVVGGGGGGVHTGYGWRKSILTNKEIHIFSDSFFSTSMYVCVCIYKM